MANEDSRIIQAQFSEMNNEQIADKIAADLAEARGRLRLLAEHLPTAVDPLAVSKTAKAPYFALCFREAPGLASGGIWPRSLRHVTARRSRLRNFERPTCCRKLRCSLVVEMFDRAPTGKRVGPRHL